jgi:hypothetical protein
MFRRQWMLLSALLAAAVTLGATQARADFVAIGDVSTNVAVHSGAALWQSSLEFASSFGSSVDDLASQTRSDTGEPFVPATPLAPFGKLPQTACNFGHAGGSGTSSGSSSGKAPSSPPLGELLRPEMPPLELASLLPPEKGDTHPFSVASFLFRPPRAA